MNRYILSLCLGFLATALWAQQNCDAALERAQSVLYKTTPFADQSALADILQPCADAGNAQAENYLGLVYLNGLGVEKDQEKAFDLISRAASKGYANAQYNLGRLYKYGMGCELSFDKAMDWFQTATANGNQRAAYSLGYMYYKGFGVPQDYSRAVHWFQKSDDPMAKHFLAICHYFGYGVSVNEQRAVELLTANPTVNSKTFLTYVKANLRQTNNETVQQALEGGEAADSTHIAPEVVKNLDLEIYPEPLSKKDIQGEWLGKLVEYDWSGEHIIRISPLELNFNINSKNSKVAISGRIAGQESASMAQFDDGNLYVEGNMGFTLDKLYSCNPWELSLDHTLFTLALEKRMVAGQEFLTGYADTFIESWTEYGGPMSVVLRPKSTEGEIDLDTLQALAAQEEQFIKLYPVPFYNSLTVQYQLEAPSNVFAELYNLHGTNRITILPTARQDAGEYTYTIPVDPVLPEGLYVVRLVAGGQVYTRMILKDN